MNWQHAARSARAAYVRGYSRNVAHWIRCCGYDTAARMANAQEALVTGLLVLAYRGAAKDNTVVSEHEWKGLK